MEKTMPNNQWTTNKIPDLSGKVIIITGANSGIGYETARAMAKKRAVVVMGCRNREKAEAAANEIRMETRKAKVKIMGLDLADLASVRRFAESFNGKYRSLDLLINNAGVMVPPYTKTKEGYELQFGVNHLGHFALTGLLLDRLLKTPKARIINVSSGAHRMGSGTIDFDNLNAEKGYRATEAYSQSKLANLLFTLELNRRFEEINSDVIAAASHPGWTVTGLQKGFSQVISRIVGQRPNMGALPTLMAAIHPEVERNEYYGPTGFMEMRGFPGKCETSQAAKDVDLAKRLWNVSEELTGVNYAWPIRS
jgi:NAD(P)-dependent dehydrogenase (short-subunit alcohol dehydrogenase family)